MPISKELFTHEKANFRERIAKLAGGTTYREPMGGRSTDPHRMTDQDVAAALAYARMGPDDMGPDIAFCIVCGSEWHRARIIKRLAESLNHAGGHWARKARAHLLTIADHSFRSVVWLERTARPEGCHPGAYGHLFLTGVIALQSLADEAIRRAERAFQSGA